MEAQTPPLSSSYILFVLVLRTEVEGRSRVEGKVAETETERERENSGDEAYGFPPMRTVWAPEPLLTTVDVAYRPPQSYFQPSFSIPALTCSSQCPIQVGMATCTLSSIRDLNSGPSFPSG